MLSAIRCRDGKKVLAWIEEKGEDTYTCPECLSVVILKKGQINTPHFAHKPPIFCQYGKGESAEHRLCKIQIYEYLSSFDCVEKCEMERSLGTVRPDISCYINGTPVAIEVQISTLTIDQIIYRTLEYAKKNIYVLWLSPISDQLYSERYRPRAWEKWVHATYFGKTYYWDGSAVAAFQFKPCATYVEEWQNREGNSGGGYFKFLKSYKKPIRTSGYLCLITDFKPVTRTAWKSAQLDVPACKIYTAS